MTNDCPKCGGSMGGPRYSPGQGCACHPEALYYSCTQCGYSMRKPTRDKDVRTATIPVQGTAPAKETP